MLSWLKHILDHQSNIVEDFKTPEELNVNDKTHSKLRDEEHVVAFIDVNHDNRRKNQSSYNEDESEDFIIEFVVPSILQADSAEGCANLQERV